MSDNRESRHEEREEIHLLHEILNELKLILKELKKDASHIVASFKITSNLIGGNSMNINPGQGTVLTAAPLDASGNPVVLPSGDVPNWSASDTSQITATPSADGLSLTVAVNSNAVAGSVIFTVTDAVIPTATGTFTLTITPAVAGNPVASFSVTASVPAKKR
jgi:hypothetical protein